MAKTANKGELGHDTNSSGEPTNASNGNGGANQFDNGSAKVIDPKTIDAGRAGEPAAESGEGKRKRGRPKGGGQSRDQKQTTSAQGSLDLKSLNALLYSCHMLLSHAVKTPELALEEKESEQLAEAAANVARHYNITAEQKTLDWGNFMICLAVMYGPRFALIVERKKKEHEKQPSQNEAGLRAV